MEQERSEMVPSTVVIAVGLLLRDVGGAPSGAGGCWQCCDGLDMGGGSPGIPCIKAETPPSPCVFGAALLPK